ncbi:glycoside hydrolase family 1 protein [Candidatus Kuenenbacteria bacterium CG10_big_fil_rev_8_21_14_0_10_36_11]|uniref:Glycoside hydrolase family 1 protein n=1 Tax=Candidatus Kuenenbacteria bacterium CG10_big_fil_rev_8_21_14_0_10_36_11 TaxID=1974618 RepID=A0A2M6WBB7_9BACT|nr:MAG: glycoside hydrolase family 1 protein [Candidatus Kuenenbacteria bacterium CG10_big_fil_rev_8_21_14_0_10_36_11]
MSIVKNFLEFPKSFLWGTASSAHQVEGNNIHSDWWAWEQENKGKILAVKEKKFKGQKFEPSEKCLDHYNRYKEDFGLMKKLNNNAHRLSIEWARIEPKEGEWNLQELEHYRNVLQTLKDQKIKVMLTLNHFTLPSWFIAKGGWLNVRSPYYFKKYAAFVAKNLGELVDFWITINEPEIYMSMCYLEGFWPPQKKDVKSAGWVYFNMARAHRISYKTIHKIIDKNFSKAKVGVAMNVMSFASYKKHSFLELFFVHAADRIVNHSFYDLTKRSHDFLGVNYYFRVRLKKSAHGFMPIVDEVSEEESELSDMGWVIYPHGIFDVLMDFKDFNLPIYITENGIATEDDAQRSKFIINHLSEIHHAIRAGVDVRGYFYWSLLDNFEWDKSFGPKFGLVAVDRKTMRRTVKPSYFIYKEICENNGVAL